MKKLKQIKELIVKLNYDLRRLVNYGFVVRYTDSASSRIYIHKKKKVVVKTPYLMGGESRSKFCIPTISFKVPEGRKAGYSKRFSMELKTVFIQPLAKRTALDRARDRLHDRGCDTDDMHSGNIGWYRGKPVVIDW